MKTLEVHLTPSSKMFHWHDGKMEFRTPGGVFTLNKDEVEGLRNYFKDFEQGMEFLYEPGRAP